MLTPKAVNQIPITGQAAMKAMTKQAIADSRVAHILHLVKGDSINRK
ncbi:hypothetical protein ACSQ6I_28030 [Anabaena sp. WFMT]